MPKISDLPAATALTGTEEIPIVQSGATKASTPVALATYMADNLPSGAYPPTPTPDLETYLQAAFTDGTAANWIWGDVELDAPVVVTMDETRGGFYVDFHGATISPSASYPVNTAVDMITFIVPDSVSIGVVGMQLKNVQVFGVNPSSAVVCRNNVLISCHLNQSGVYGLEVSQCTFVAAGRSGLQLYGSVFEADMIGLLCRDSVFAGVELRNPTQGGGAGVISSIKFYGGDYRTNRYGIASTAETTFQEASGFHIYGSDFIINNSAGVFATSGVALIHGCHFENNCANNSGECVGAIFVPGGQGVHLFNCDNAFITSIPGIYLLDMVGFAGSFAVIHDHCTSLNETTGGPSPTGKLSGTGSAWIENFDDPSHYDGVGGWTVWKTSATSTTV